MTAQEIVDSYNKIVAAKSTFNSSPVGYNEGMEDMSMAGNVAVIDRPTLVNDSPAVSTLAMRQAAQCIPTGQRREFIQWLRLLRRRGYNLPQDSIYLAQWMAVGTADLTAELIHTATDVDLGECFDCNAPQFDDQLTDNANGDTICGSCLDRRYFTCRDCEEYHLTRYRVQITHHGYICDDCHSNGDYNSCASCSGHFPSDEGSYAENGNDWYCDGCGVPDEPSGSECESRNLTFTFPALCTPQKAIQNDEIVPVTIGSGEVSPQGLQAVRDAIYRATGHRLDLPEIRDMDAAWQSKEGNFPKRLAKLVQSHSLKLSDELMANCGNVAKAHVSKIATRYVSVTRDLNMEPDAYCNGGSCWWTDYSSSRCELKAWNGFAVRTWRNMEAGKFDEPDGRAWLLPVQIKDGRIVTRPTATLPADGYLLFNTYGDIEQLALGRIVAGMVGKSYRKVGFDMAAYINSGAVLIAEQSVCDATEYVSLPSVRECGCG